MNTFRLGIGTLAVLLALQSPAQADEPQFALIEHRAVVAPPEPDPSAWPSTVGEASSNPSSASLSFREVIYAASVKEAEQRYGLPPGLLHALIWTESRFNPLAVSPAGAAGLAQLMPGTAHYLGVSNRHDPFASIDGGARYLREMLDKFGAIHLALAAYNAGPRAVERAGGIPRNSETPGYVRNVLARWRTIGS